MNKEMLKSAMTHGAIIGASIVVYSLVLYMFGYDEFNPNRKFSFLSLVTNFIIIGGIIWAQINYRNKSLNGIISYGHSIGYAMLVGAFYAIIYTFYLILFFKFIDTDKLQYIFDVTEQNLIDSGMTTADIDKSMVMVKKMTFPSMLLGGIFGNAFFALIVSLISSIFIKKEKNPFEQDMKNIE